MKKSCGASREGKEREGKGRKGRGEREREDVLYMLSTKP